MLIYKLNFKYQQEMQSNSKINVKIEPAIALATSSNNHSTGQSDPSKIVIIPSKEADLRKFKTARLEDYDLTRADRRIVTKTEYSGGFRMPLESFNKPYMKNKCWKAVETLTENKNP